MKIITKKKLKEECWNLDYEFVKWLDEHLRIFLKDTDKHIDLDFHKFDYMNCTLTLREMIEELIDTTGYLVEHYYDWDNLEAMDNNKKKMYAILEQIHFYLWW